MKTVSIVVNIFSEVVETTGNDKIVVKVFDNSELKFTYLMSDYVYHGEISTKRMHNKIKDLVDDHILKGLKNE